MIRNFALSTDDFSRILEFVSGCLRELKLNSRDVIRAEIMCEESLASLMEHAELSEKNNISVEVKNFLGNVTVTFAVPGGEFEFSAGIEGTAGGDYSAEDVRNIFLHSFRHYIKYRHSRNHNIVKISVIRSSYAGLYMALAALAAAVAAGLLMRMFAPENLCLIVNENIFIPVRTIFMNVLKMCAVPVVFFSAVLSISEAGNAAGIRRTGGRLVKYFAFTQTAALVIGFALAVSFETGSTAHLAAEAQTAGSYSLEMKGFLTAIVPDNIMRPFLEGNMLQLIIVAMLTGTSINLTEAQRVRDIIRELNMIFMKSAEIFMQMMPFVMFCSAASMIVTAGLDNIMSLLGVMCTFFAGIALLAVIDCAMLKAAGVSPLIMLRKSIPVFVTAFSTVSSTAAIPDSMSCCRSMGISERLYSFAIPLGISLCKATIPIYYSVLLISAANMYGVAMPFSKIISLSVLIIILSLALPGIAGGALISLSVLLSEAGCPLEFIAFAAMIDNIADITATPVVCMNNIACTLLTASKEGLLDLEMYNKQ